MYYYDYPAISARQMYGSPQQMPAQGQGPGTMMPSQMQMPGSMMQAGQPALPTGVPLGPITGDILNPEETVMSTEYTQGYLKTQIGKRVNVEFVIGTDMFIDKQGILVEVGASYIIIRESNTNQLQLCDMYSIKFVTFYDTPVFTG